MSGCAVCVYDLYEESLAAYKDAVDALRQSLTAMQVPESDWPVDIQTKLRHAANEFSESQRKEKILSAFDELEQALATKKQKHADEDAQC